MIANLLALIDNDTDVALIVNASVTALHYAPVAYETVIRPHLLILVLAVSVALLIEQAFDEHTAW